MADEVTMDTLFGNFGVEIKSASVVENSRVAVEWSDGSATSLYPMLMLRDCCPCEKCFNPVVNSRLILFEHLLESSCSVSQLSYEVSPEHSLHNVTYSLIIFILCSILL